MVNCPGSVPYTSSNKTNGRNPEPVAVSIASMAASGPASLGDGSASSSLASTPDSVKLDRTRRFREKSEFA